MKISVIIAVYNRLHYLRNILLALENQTLKPYEVIIADDGSSESLEENIRNIKDKISYKIKHVYQCDKGFRAARSRNNGVRVAEGEYIVFLDQDVLFDENFFEKIKKYIKKGQVIKMDAVSLEEKRSKTINKKIDENNEYKYKYVEENLTSEDKKYIIKKYRKDKIRNLLYGLKLSKRGSKLIGLGIGIYKEDFIKINGFDEKYIGWGYEDDDLGNRMYAAGLKIIPFNTSKILVHMYHKEETSKKISLNEEYYYERKKEILKNKNYKCEYGYDNTYGEDKVLEKIIKE